jgi:tetratricopeptide (TPR) repeat protein
MRLFCYPFGMRSVLFALALLIAFPTASRADEADTHYRSAMAYKEQGKVDEAIKELEAAVKLRATHSMAWNSLGILYKKKGDIKKAITAFEEAAKIVSKKAGKKDAPIHANLGMAYGRDGRADDAIASLEMALKLDPTNTDAGMWWAFMGTLRRQKGDIDGAIKNLEAAIKAEPKNAEYLNNLGVAYRHAKRDDDAIRVFKLAIEADPKVAEYNFNLATVYRRKEQFDDAIASYKAAVALDDKLADAWYDLGVMYRTNHDNEPAVEAFTKYLALTKGKDKSSDERVRDEIRALGGDVKDAPADAPKPKKKKNK